MSFIEDHKVLVGVLVAVSGYLVKYFHDASTARTRARLERINSQLKLLYGPLYVLSSASHQAWIAFRKHYRPGGRYFRDDSPPNEEEKAAWRLWMTTVFMPLNRQMAESILKNGDLLEQQMPQEFLKLLSHVAAYEPVIQAWKDGDFTRHLSLIDFPQDFESHVKGIYQQLRKLQAAELGRRFKGA